MNKLLSIPDISPYIRYVNDVSFIGPYHMPNRILYDHELIFPISGEAKMTYGDEIYYLNQGICLHMKPLVDNQMSVETGKQFHAHCIHFDWFPSEDSYNFTAEQYYMRTIFSPEEKEYIEALKKRPNYEISDVYFPTLFTGLSIGTFIPMCRELFKLYQHPGISSILKQKSLFLKLVTALLSEKLTEDGTSKEHYYTKIVNQSVNYMRIHYEENLSTSFFSAKYNLSPKYFGTIFKSITGITFAEFLLDLRMQEARQFLTTTSNSVNEIAESVGIHDVYYFTKLFSKQEGIPPARYRQMMRQKPLT